MPRFRSPHRLAAMPTKFAASTMEALNSPSWLPRTRMLGGQHADKPADIGVPDSPSRSTATLNGRAFSRGSLKVSMRPLRRRPRLARRNMPNQTSPSGATARPLRPAFSLPTSKSENCPSLNRPMRFARNSRNHTEPSDPAACQWARRRRGERRMSYWSCRLGAGIAGCRFAVSPIRRRRPSRRPHRGRRARASI